MNLSNQIHSFAKSFFFVHVIIKRLFLFELFLYMTSAMRFVGKKYSHMISTFSQKKYIFIIALLILYSFETQKIMKTRFSYII
jgi:hypothetical protein